MPKLGRVEQEIVDQLLADPKLRSIGLKLSKLRVRWKASELQTVLKEMMAEATEKQASGSLVKSKR